MKSWHIRFNNNIINKTRKLFVIVTSICTCKKRIMHQINKTIIRHFFLVLIFVEREKSDHYRKKCYLYKGNHK